MRFSAVVLVVAACGRIGFDAQDWLVVTTREDRMSGPGTIASIDELPAGIEDLSLREALAIAKNHAGRDVITFDATVFPANAPAVIVLGSTLELGGPETIVDATGRGVAIDAAPGFAGTLLHVGTDADSRIVGLEIRGPGSVAAPRVVVVAGLRVELAELVLRPAEGVGIRVENARTIVLRDVTIDGVRGTAIQIDRGTDVVVEGAAITNTLGDPITAVDSSGLAIRKCSIIIDPAATGRGVVFQRVDHSQVVDNFIDPGAAQLVRLEDSSDNEIVGNVLDRGEVAIALFGASTNNVVFRNVVVSNPEPLYVDTMATGTRLLHNTLYMSGGIVDNAPATQIANNLESDTGFVAPASFDFHLVVGSRAVDAATDLGLDLLPDHSERFLGAAPDLGAVETR